MTHDELMKGPPLIILALTAVLLTTAACKGSSNSTEPMTPPVVTPPGLEAIATPPPTPSTLPGLPTAEPGRALVESTLFDLFTNRSLPLWTAGIQESVSAPSFSSDSRYMVFAKANMGDSKVYLVDLQAPTLNAIELGEGYAPMISPDGRTIAVTRAETATTLAVDIWTERGSGSRFSLASNAFGASWSPDSRWLVYQKTFTAPGEPVGIVLVDSRSWQQRDVGSYIPCQCDGLPLPQWSSNSRFFSYRSPATGSGIVSTDGTPVDALPQALAWHPDGLHYLWQKETRTANGVTYDIGIYDLSTGTSTTLVPAAASGNGTVAATGGALWSQDGALAYVGARIDGNYVLVVYDRNGQRVGELDAAFMNAPSRDGHFTAGGKTKECGEALSVGVLTGSKPSSWPAAVNCIQISGQLYQGAWSPVADSYIFIQSRQIGADAQNNGEVATTDVVLLDAATLQTKVIATDVRGLNCLTWSPDGRYVLFHSCGP